ncbi:MAG: ABC transporter permease, partial [Ignavibacteria bacterium]
LFAGIYPALLLSKFKPVKILSGKLGTEKGSFGLRKILVIAQFAVSAVLIISAIVIDNQLNFIRNKNLGFEKNYLIVIDINSNNVTKNFQVMKNEFRSHPGVKNVTVSSGVPGDWKDISRIDIANFGSSISSAINTYFIGADEKYLGTYKINIKEGRNFSGEISDSSSILLNEAAVKSLNLTDPLGKEISVFNTYYNGSQEKTDFKARVIGIVRDFHFRSLYQEIKPIVIGFWNNPMDRIDYFTAEISGTNIPGTIHYLKTIGEKFDPVHPFEYNFLDERINDFYKKDQKFGKLIAASTFLAIFIAALGLLGLSLFTFRQRTKEVGIRKVLGASIPSIVMTLSKEFMILVLLSLVLSFPAAYFLLNKWLQNYAYRTGIDFLTFLAAGFMILFIAASSISIQIIKAAASNPVKSLRYE